MQASSQDFFEGRLHRYLRCMYAYISKQACRVWGDAPPRKCLDIRCSEIASGGIFGQKQSCSSYYFIQFLAVLHAFAKPADFKFPQEKVLRLAEQQVG